MSTAELRKSLHDAIDNADESKLYSLHEAVMSELKGDDWYDTLTTIQKGDLDNAIAELDNGEGISHEEVLKKYKGKHF